MWKFLQSRAARLYYSFTHYIKSVISLAINAMLDLLGAYTMSFVILSMNTGVR